MQASISAMNLDDFQFSILFVTVMSQELGCSVGISKKDSQLWGEIHLDVENHVSQNACGVNLERQQKKDASNQHWVSRGPIVLNTILQFSSHDWLCDQLPFGIGFQVRYGLLMAIGID